MSHELNQRFPVILAGTPRYNTTGNINLDGGFLISAGQNIMILNQVTNSSATTYGPGTFGFYNPNTWQSVYTTNPSTLNCCPLVLVGASPYTKDSPGGFHQGWQIPFKSKPIHPANVHHFYRIDPCTPQPGVYHFGQTPKTTSTTLNTNAVVDLEVINVSCTGTGSIPVYPTIAGPVTPTIVSAANPLAAVNSMQISVSQTAANSGVYYVTLINGPTSANFTVGDILQAVYTVGPDTCTVTFRVTEVSKSNNCCHNFVCNETYSFFFETKGTPVYQAYFKNVIRQITIKTPCCDPNNTANIYVDPRWVYLELAKAVIQDPELSKFIMPIVYDGVANAYYYPPQELYPGVTYPAGTLLYSDLANVLPANLLSSTSFCSTSQAGIIFQTAYIETRFGDCTFVPADGYTYDTIHLKAQLADWNGEPCFEAICYFAECYGHPGQGSGEDAIRDLIRMQNFQAHPFPDNLRYREVLLENDVMALVNRSQRYYRYQFLFEHKPYREFAAHPIDTNPYRVEIITSAINTSFENFVNGWLNNCSPCPGMEVIGCERCDFDLINPSTGQSVILGATNA